MSLTRRVATALWRQGGAVRGFLPDFHMGGLLPTVVPAAATVRHGGGSAARKGTWGPFCRFPRGMATVPGDKGDAGGEARQQDVSEAASDSESIHNAELLSKLKEMSTEQLHEHVVEIKKDLDEKEAHIAEMKDRLVRTLADMENLRDRTSKQLEEARKFATQGLVKSLVDVADNLERAAASVVKDLDAAELDVEKAIGLLHGLKDGVVMTDGILMKILEKEGVTRYDPAGESFDPNLHEALFEVPASGDAKPGTVAVVVKKGYLMHDRAVRAAEVGVVKSED